MKVSVLSSGSKGNTTFVETSNTKILLDCGNTYKYINDKLKELSVDMKEIDAIFISHVHSDHIKGLKALIKKIHPTIYITEKMLPYLDYLDNYTLIKDNQIIYKDLTIDIIKTSHDTEDSNAYIITNNDSSVVYLTDTGYINQRYYEILTNRSLYIFESNHDIELLNHSSYPFALRKRILSDKGHLSNYDSAKYLASFIGKNTKEIILAHLSEENNTESLALESLQERLIKEHIEFDKIIIAKQNERTDLIEV